jgi:hypothetical protein
MAMTGISNMSATGMAIAFSAPCQKYEGNIITTEYSV